MLIFHQAGHNSNWNLFSLDDGIGDGMIISPVHRNIDNVKDIVLPVKEKCLFDPQFYVPDSQKTKLNSYDFFPEKLMNGFSTNDFAALAYDAAEMCVDFQLKNSFKSLVIPARYYDDMLTDFIDKQKAFSVEPFLAYIERMHIRKDIFMTLPLTSSMISDKKYRIQLLNWVTAYPQITGVYLLVNFNEPMKQITDPKKIIDYLDFVKELQEAELQTICGYCNTESLLWTIIMPYAVTIGAYENTRRFSINKFLDEESEVRGPAPRIYFPKLLNWVRYDTAMEIRDELPDLWEKIYTPTKHIEVLFQQGIRPYFNKPELYYHHFELIYKQLKQISSIDVISTRVDTMQNWIASANELYSEIQKAGILFFDNNCKGEHLPVWNRVIRKLR